MRRDRVIQVWLCLVVGCVAAQWAVGQEAGEPVFDRAFWGHWGDGQAELSSYDLVMPRYGQPRRGTAVAIFVTETFSDLLRVKADPGKHPPADQFPVMKLNLMRDFPTGVYDYNLMTSAFVALAARDGRPAGATTKVSFGSQEWCGHVYQQALFDRAGVRYQSHSYFDGEADQSGTMDYPSDGVAEDSLLLWARGLAWPTVEPGREVSVPVLRSLTSARLNHVPLAWLAAKLRRSAQVVDVAVPAGTFKANVCEVQIENERSWTIYVEESEPRRILKWETSDSQKAELIATARLKYWEMNGAGFESALEKLGLQPRPPRTP